MVRFSRRQLAVLLGVSLYQCALIGILINSASVLLAAIQQARALPMSMISAHTTIRSVAGALLGPALVRWFYRSGKPVFLMGCIVSIVIGHVLLTLRTPAWVWYAVPVLLSPCTCIGVFAAPCLLAPWFPGKTGFSTGFALAFSGLGGMLFNPIAAHLVETVGWQRAIWALCVLTLGLAAIALALVFRGSAPDQTNAPEKAERKSVDAKRLPVRSGTAFALCQLCLLETSIAVSLVNFTSLYIRSAGYSLAFSASVMSFVMGGNILGKVIFGMASDRIGTWRTAAIHAALVAAGLVTMVTGKRLPALLLPAAFFFGTCYAGATIAVSKCTLAAYGAQESRKWGGLHASCNSAAAALLSMETGFVYDRTGSFQPAFLFAAACAAVSSCAALAGSRLAGRAEKTAL